MKRQVYAAKQNPSAYINKVGKYLNSHIDGAFKIKFSPMHCDVTMRMYYQIPGDPNSLNEMHFTIDITAYQDKLRINLTEDTLLEKTIGQIILTVDQLADLGLVRKRILAKIEKFINKEFAEYDFIY